MLFEASISVDRDGNMELRDRWSAGDAVFRSLAALFYCGVGSLVVGVFVSGAGPKVAGDIGARILGSLVIGVFFLALGVLPLGQGLGLLFARHIFTFDLKGGTLRSCTIFAGVRFWTRRRELASFQRLVVADCLFGVFVRRRGSLVSLEGSQRVEVSLFADRDAAVAFASGLGIRLSRPFAVVDGRD